MNDTNEALTELDAQTKVLAALDQTPRRLPEIAERASLTIDVTELALNQVWQAGFCERRTLANGAWHYCK